MARPKPLSEAASKARRPPAPEELVAALQDRVHRENGRLIRSQPLRESKHDPA